MSREADWYLADEAGGMNGEDIGVTEPTSGGKKGCRPGVEGKVDESGISNGASSWLICFLRFSYEEEWSREEMVKSSSP